MSKSKSIVDVDKPQFGYFTALYRSLYSKQLYIDVVKRWKGFGLLYLVVMVAIFSLPISIYVANTALSSLNENIIQPLSQLPNFNVTNGKVIFEHPMPYVINNKTTGQPALIVDTTGQYKSLKDKGLKTVSTLITSDTLYVRGADNKITKQKLGSLGTSEQFNAKSFVDKMPYNKMRWIFKLSSYPIVAGVLYGVLVVMLMLFAALGQIMANTVMHFKMSYKQATRVAFVAATPFFIISGINYSLFQYNNYLGMVQFAVLLAYFIFAVRVNKKVSKQLVHG